MAAIVQWKIENAREFSVASRHDSGWNCKMTFVRSSLFAVVQLPRVSVKKNRAKDRELVLYIPFLYCNQFPCLGCYIGCCIQQASISWDTNDNNPTKCPPILHQGFHSIGVCHIIAIQKKTPKSCKPEKKPGGTTIFDLLNFQSSAFLLVAKRRCSTPPWSLWSWNLPTGRTSAHTSAQKDLRPRWPGTGSFLQIDFHPKLEVCCFFGERKGFSSRDRRSSIEYVIGRYWKM